MRLILDRIVDFCAIMAAIFTYLALRDFSFGLDTALCVGYTVEVLGISITDQKVKVFSSDPARPIPKILLLHACFLAAVVLIVRIWVFIKPMMPQPVPHQGRSINWGLLAVVIALFALAYWEERMLFRKSSSAAPETNVETDIPEPLASPSESVLSVTGIALDSPAESASVAVEPIAVAPVAAEPVASYTIAPTEAAAPMGFTLTSANAADEHEAFMAYLHGRERAFRRPGVSIKQEYEKWLAHRAKVLSGDSAKKTSGLARFLRSGRNLD